MSPDPHPGSIRDSAKSQNPTRRGSQEIGGINPTSGETVAGTDREILSVNVGTSYDLRAKGSPSGGRGVERSEVSTDFPDRRLSSMNEFRRLGVVTWAFLTLSASTGAAEPTRTTANVPVEIAFTSVRDRPDPFNDIHLDAVFRSPSGKTFRVPTFWAGGRVWKVRYASGEVGEHRFRTEGNDVADTGLQGIEGRVEVGSYGGANPLFQHGPIKVAADKRHMEHADGTPFFWLGDTWWMGLCHRLHFPDEFATLAADRKAKGFNVVQIVAGLYPDMPPFDPRGANEAGFPWEPKYARIRPQYFDAVDLRLRYLVEQGITPCVVGMWGYFMPEMGVDKSNQHWRYLIARYGSWPVVWCVAGEANLPYYQAKGFPFDDREQVHKWTEVLRYVRATDPFRRPTTIHPTAIRLYTARNATDDAALLDFDLLQTPHGQREAAAITLQAARESYAARPRMPVIDGEASYERLSDSLPTEWTRAMFWICMAEGAAGHTYGANGIWQCNRKGQPHGNSPSGGNYGVISWDDAMNLPGSGQLGAGKTFLTKFAWTRFEPHPEWVTWDAPASAQPPELGRWIWFPEGDASKDAPVEARFFRRAFSIPEGKGIVRARLRLAADDKFTAWVNGKEAGTGGAWNDPSVIDVTASLHAGQNLIAIRAENAKAPVKLNPAGLIAGLEVELQDGSIIRIGTDATWSASKVETPGWREVGPVVGVWPKALDMGPIGMNPWGTPQPRAAFPPLAFGSPDGPRLFYLLDPKPIIVRGLAPGKTYHATLFDPVKGEEESIGDLKADASGTINRQAPSHGHDWVFSLTP